MEFYNSDYASPTLKRFAHQIAKEIQGTVLDVPCGYGRNAILMSLLGCRVICLDNNSKALAALKENYSTTAGELVPMFCDLKKEAWEFSLNSLGAILNIHFVMPELFKYFEQSLMPGGFLFIETYDNRGGNYLELPKKGEFKNLLASAFNFLYYAEKKAGPPDVDACTVKLLAQKR